MQRTIAKPRRGTPREFPRSLALALFYVLLGIAALTAESSMPPAYLEALRRGDATELRRLLDQGADPSVQPTPDEPGFLFGGGRSPLMWAAFRGDTRIIQLLLDAGAEVNAPNPMGTPLAQAAWADQLEVARLLLNHGAVQNIPGFSDGYRPLHWAASRVISNICR